MRRTAIASSTSAPPPSSACSYRDGFFHADLHPDNLVILPGPRPDLKDFRREVEDVCRRWQRAAS